MHTQYVLTKQTSGDAMLATSSYLLPPSCERRGVNSSEFCIFMHSSSQNNITLSKNVNNHKKENYNYMWPDSNIILIFVPFIYNYYYKQNFDVCFATILLLFK